MNPRGSKSVLRLELARGEVALEAADTGPGMDRNVIACHRRT